jgi:putative endonuclease
MSAPPAAPHLALGRRGEDLAARYLWDSEHLLVLARNWRCSEGELDLVLTDGRQLVFCEVKTRTSNAYGTPAESVTDRKAHRVRRLARRWRVAQGVQPWVPDRFDIVSILWPPNRTPVIDHQPTAF